MNDVLLDAFIDSAKLIPLLYLSYFFISYSEKKGSLATRLNYLFVHRLGPVFGALLGCLPQCGFSMIAASLYVQGGISVGTLVAVFISTSDEALPMLLAHPQEYKTLGLLIVIKIILAILFGLFIDLFVKPRKLNDEETFEVDNLSCGCNDSIFINSFNRTFKTILLILVVNVVMGSAIHLIGEETFSTFLNVNESLQPLFAGLIGFIPNCASSVMIVQLYLLNDLSFGAMVAGLSTGAGVGIAVLFKMNKSIRNTLFILSYLLVVSVISGMIIQMLGFT